MINFSALAESILSRKTTSCNFDSQYLGNYPNGATYLYHLNSLSNFISVYCHLYEGGKRLYLLFTK